MSSTEGEKAPSKNDSSSQPKDSAGQMDPKKVCLQLDLSKTVMLVFPLLPFFDGLVVIHNHFNGGYQIMQ